MQPASLLLAWLAVVTGVTATPLTDFSSDYGTTPSSTKHEQDTSWWWPSSDETSTPSSWSGMGNAKGGGDPTNTATPTPQYSPVSDWFTTPPSVETYTSYPTWSPVEATKTDSWSFLTTTPKPTTNIDWPGKASDLSPYSSNSEIPTNYNGLYKESTYTNPPAFEPSYPTSDKIIPSPSYKLPSMKNAILSSNTMSPINILPTTSPKPYISSKYETSTQSPSTVKIEEDYEIPPISTKKSYDDIPNIKEEPSSPSSRNETSSQEDDEEYKDQKMYPESSSKSDNKVQESKIIDKNLSAKIASNIDSSEINTFPLGVKRASENVTSQSKPLDFSNTDLSPSDDKSSIERDDEEKDLPKTTVQASTTEQPTTIKVDEGRPIAKGVGRSPWSPVEPKSTSISDPNTSNADLDYDMPSATPAKPSTSNSDPGTENSPSLDRGVGRSNPQVESSNGPSIYDMTKTTSNFVPLKTLGPSHWARQGSRAIPVETVVVEEPKAGDEATDKSSVENDVSKDHHHKHHHIEGDTIPLDHHAVHHHHQHHDHIHNRHHQSRSIKSIVHHNHIEQEHHHIPHPIEHHHIPHPIEHNHIPHPIEHHDTTNPTVITTQDQSIPDIDPVNSLHHVTRSLATDVMMYSNNPLVPFFYRPPVLSTSLDDAHYDPQEMLF